ncbi:hypothetical protein [Campylobacter sp. CCS1377]|uniref:Uncharacterized protein n=1 Tax=Campylobacter sp. CCS1377 TaxID=3158229 RepID=A0AAU7E4P9_9BACT
MKGLILNDEVNISLSKQDYKKFISDYKKVKQELNKYKMRCELLEIERLDYEKKNT